MVAVARLQPDYSFRTHETDLMPTRNPYLDQIRQALPRLLALYDRDKTSRSFGVGDRYFWAWGLIEIGVACGDCPSAQTTRVGANGSVPC